MRAIAASTCAVYSDGLIDETEFPDATLEQVGLPAADFDRLIDAARTAREGGITLFTGPDRHTGAAALTWSGRIYRAAGADDAAFHYRFPVGGVLSRPRPNATIWSGPSPSSGPRAPGRTWRIATGSTVSSSAASRPCAGGRRRSCCCRMVVERVKATTFDLALPKPFSVARFNPDALERFLDRQRVAPAAVVPPAPVAQAPVR